VRKPDFFIVGAPRCGTTALFEYLEQHPDIFGSSLKEPHFFGTDTLYPRRPAVEQYLAYFADASAEKRIGEGSTSYLFSKLAAKEIHEFCPTARIIIMLRDPVETMYSVHSMVLYFRDEDIDDFETALEAEDDRKRGLRLPAKPHIIDYLYYREVVRFAEQVKRYFDVCGRERVHVIIHDDLKRDTAGVYRETLEFLDVDASFQANLRVVNANRGVRSTRFQDLVLNPRLARLREKALPKRADEIIFGTLRRLNTTPAARKPMRPELKRRLQIEFAPEVERLSELLRRDLTGWCGRSPVKSEASG
jgi:hypothetical protein